MYSKQIMIAIFTVSILTMSSVLHAQQDSIARLRYIFTSLQRVYRQDKSLNYTIHYTYSTPQTPKIVLDSASAMVSIKGDTYHCKVNNTEILSTDSITVVLFKDEKIMYLSKARQQAALYNPAAMLDTLIENHTVTGISFDSSNDARSVSLEFNPATGYKSIRFSIDAATGYISSIQYIVRTDMLTEKMDGYAGHGDITEYAVVSAHFDNYNQLAVVPIQFNDFYLKDGKNYKVTGKYRDYQLYLGSSGL